MIYLPCDNDVTASEFESKLDPVFCSGYVEVTNRQQALRSRRDFNESRSGFVPQKRAFNSRDLGRNAMPPLAASQALKK